MRIGFIGAGRVGTALALGLAQQRYQVVAVASRCRASAAALVERIPGCQVCETPQAVAGVAELVFLAVPDDGIAVVAAALPWRPGMAAVHCSGAVGLEVLAPAAAAGARVGAFHPLQTFASAEAAPGHLAGVTIALEGEEPLASTLEAMARALGGRPIRLPAGSKALYHASAVLASNYVISLVQRAAELWAAFGVPRDEALAALLPLLRGTVANLERLGPPQALTGPIARGDVGTVRRHLEALASRAPDLIDLYCHLGLETIPLAVARGTLPQEPAEELRQILRSSCSTREERTCA